MTDKLNEKEKILIKQTYSDHEDMIKGHTNVLNHHTDEIRRIDDMVKEHGRKISNIEEDVSEMKPVVDENKDANVRQSILMEQISKNVEGMRTDFKTMFKWLLGGFTVVIFGLAGFLIWALQLMASGGI